MSEETLPPAPDQPTTQDYTGGQFPSLDGNVSGEIAQRQVEKHDDGFFAKIFSVHNRSHTSGLDADHEYHRRNMVAVIQDALQRGLHPKGEPELVGERPHPSDPDTTDLEYRVQVVPAIVDHEPGLTATPSVELVPDAPAPPGE